MPFNNNTALIIFIRNAEKGKVKTRLAATVGDDKALAIYKALMQHTRNIALATDTNRLLFYSNDINYNDDWSNSDFQKGLQHNGDLGERITAAFTNAFERFQRVVIIGSDCASLHADIVADAFNLLNTNDFVIGPATDGGYYLFGMRALHPEVFQNIAWSTDSVFPETVKIIEKINGSYVLLPELSDIDFEKDWEEFGWEL